MTSEPFARPGPQPENELDAAFWAHCRERRLCFQRCSGCRAWRHIPRVLCPHCGDPGFEWEEASGRGRVHSWTVTHQPPIPVFQPDAPYAAIVVELEEGVRMVSLLRGLPLDELELELPVRLDFEPLGEDGWLPVFRPDPDFRPEPEAPR